MPELAKSQKLSAKDIFRELDLENEELVKLVKELSIEEKLNLSTVLMELASEDIREVEALDASIPRPDKQNTNANRNNGKRKKSKKQNKQPIDPNVKRRALLLSRVKLYVRILGKDDMSIDDEQTKSLPAIQESANTQAFMSYFDEMLTFILKSKETIKRNMRRL